jgi:hypothetical protein
MGEPFVWKAYALPPFGPCAAQALLQSDSLAMDPVGHSLNAAFVPPLFSPAFPARQSQHANAAVCA